jgi:plasmid maintenance system killer protein
MPWSAIIDISWSDHKLEKNCVSDARGQRTWGADQWKLLKRRLASLLAAPTLDDMEGVPGRCHQLTGDRRGQFAISLGGSYRLIFVPDHDPIPTLADGGIDRSLVTKISITEVVDYHGD